MVKGERSKPYREHCCNCRIYGVLSCIKQEGLIRVKTAVKEVAGLLGLRGVPGSEWGDENSGLTQDEVSKYRRYETALGARGAPFVWPVVCGNEEAEQFYCDPSSGKMECAEYRLHGRCSCIEKESEVWERNDCLGIFRGCFYGLHLDQPFPTGAPTGDLRISRGNIKILWDLV